MLSDSRVAKHVLLYDYPSLGKTAILPRARAGSQTRIEPEAWKESADVQERSHREKERDSGTTTSSSVGDRNFRGVGLLSLHPARFNSNPPSPCTHPRLRFTNLVFIPNYGLLQSRHPRGPMVRRRLSKEAHFPECEPSVRELAVRGLRTGTDRRLCVRLTPGVVFLALLWFLFWSFGTFVEARPSCGGSYYFWGNRLWVGC